LVICHYCENHPDAPGITVCTNCEKRFCWSTKHIEGVAATNPKTGKPYPINPVTLQRHLCYNDKNQGGRDAVVPTNRESKAIRELSDEKHQLYLNALETLFRSNYDEIGNLKPEFEIREDGMIHRRHIGNIEQPKPIVKNTIQPVQSKL
jgi:hypothetical protein